VRLIASETFAPMKRILDVRSFAPTAGDGGCTAIDNLDGETRFGDDALFRDWPRVDAIIGNPPHHPRIKMTNRNSQPKHILSEYERNNEVPGRADYW